MQIRRSLALIASLLGPMAAAAPNPAAESGAGREVQAHVTFLADDLLEGRRAGTRGFDLAARYVATEFLKLGLKPGGPNGSFWQPVQLRETTRDFQASKFIIQTPNKPDLALEPVSEFLIAPALGSESADVSGPAVFVGYGVHAPDQGYSDLEGIDLKGKIAVVLFGAPAKLPGTARAHFSDRDTKATELARRGAIGLITVKTPAEEARNPWVNLVASSRFAPASLLGPDGKLVDIVPEIRVGGSTSPGATAKLFAVSPKPFADLVAAAERSEPQHVALGISLTLSARAKEASLATQNVLGILPGSDPALANDYIVVTSHLDHLGIGAAVNGDTIYNGAIDNAIGVASLIAAANYLVEQGVKPRRPILFAAVTAEEKGLLGARHLSRNPPAGGTFAANLNVDAGAFFAPLRAVIGMGKEHTTLGKTFESVATGLNWTIRPDPRPEDRRFVRSDQYSFVREGVPALRVLAAAESTDTAINLTEIDRIFWRDRYHKPSDDLQQSIHYESAGAFAVLLAEVTRQVADSAQPPAWLPGDFFGARFGRGKK